jgi:hypothetical protein
MTHFILAMTWGLNALANNGLHCSQEFIDLADRHRANIHGASEIPKSLGHGRSEFYRDEMSRDEVKALLKQAQTQEGVAPARFEEVLKKNYLFASGVKEYPTQSLFMPSAVVTETKDQTQIELLAFRKVNRTGVQVGLEKVRYLTLNFKHLQPKGCELTSMTLSPDPKYPRGVTVDASFCLKIAALNPEATGEFMKLIKSEKPNLSNMDAQMIRERCDKSSPKAWPLRFMKSKPDVSSVSSGQSGPAKSGR